MKSSRVVLAGVFSLVAFGCQVDQPLGDLENEGGMSGDSGDAGEAGSMTGGSATGGSGTGGSGTGGVSTGGVSTGGVSTGGASTGGATTGGSGGGDPGECFSPDVRPELGIDPNARGCSCSPELEEGGCIAVPNGPGLHLLAMICIDGSWRSVQDGACPQPPDQEPACLVGNRVYQNGSAYPDPFSCNTCYCGARSCTTAECPRPCPAGTVAGERCRACGSPGGCAIMEFGCFAPCEEGEPCEFGNCRDGVCQAGPCI